MEFLLPQDKEFPLATIAFFMTQNKTKGKHVKADVTNVQFKFDGKTIEGNAEITQYLATTYNIPAYPAEHRAEIDQWIHETSIDLRQFEAFLAFRTYIVGHSITLADIAAWGLLKNVPATFPRILRFKATVETDPIVKRYLGWLAPKAIKAKADPTAFVTRFAPEPSGFLHIGHSKAALLAASFAHDHKGTFILRFDDTNPDIESKAFEDMIRSDFSLLGLKADREEHTSDYFPVIFSTVEKMLVDGLAFADDSTKEQMKQQRDNFAPSPNRDNPVAKNQEMWAEMKKGTASGAKICLRAKIDYQSKNGCLRDPCIFRCKVVDGKPCVFPTYDLACPIVDSAAGVTHAMRSAEYTDRDEQYKWFLTSLGLRKIEIVSFSRLSFKYTCLGKRYLRALVAKGAASGWDDPRFPTFRGIARRGMQAKTLQTFCREQGCAKNQNLHDWDKIWALNRDNVAKDCPRVMSVSVEGHMICHVNGAQEGTIECAVHPKKPEMGKHLLHTAPVVWVEKFDVAQIKVGEKVSFLHWSNAIVDEIKENEITVHLIDDQNFKSTYKLNWIVPDKGVHIIMREFDHLLSVDILDTDKDLFSQTCNPAYLDTELICDDSFAHPKRGTIVQLERRAEVIVDEEDHEGKPLSFLIPTGTASPIGLPIKVQLFHNVVPEGTQ